MEDLIKLQQNTDSNIPQEKCLNEKDNPVSPFCSQGIFCSKLVTKTINTQRPAYVECKVLHNAQKCDTLQDKLLTDSNQPFSSAFLELTLPLPTEMDVVIISVGSDGALSTKIENTLMKYGFQNLITI